MPGSASYNQGDIFSVDFPFTDIKETKRRPAIIISNSKVNRSSSVICLPITSQVYNDEFTFEIKDKDLTTKLPLRSEIRCNKLFSIDKSKIHKRVSHLHTPRQIALFNKVKTFIEVLNMP